MVVSEARISYNIDVDEITRKNDMKDLTIEARFVFAARSLEEKKIAMKRLSCPTPCNPPKSVP